MKICFSGTHGVGKTTLLQILKSSPYYNSVFEFIDEITRTLQKEKGIKINEKGDDESQILLALKHYEININNKNFITDRGILDVLVYTHYLYQNFRCSEETLNFVKTLFKHINYDLIFYIKPEFELVNDGVRSVNNKFQKDIEEIFEHYIRYFQIKVIVLSGSVEDRIKVIKEKISNNLK